VPASCFGTHTELYIPFAGHHIHSTTVNEQNVCSCFISEFLQPDRQTDSVQKAKRLYPATLKMFTVISSLRVFNEYSSQKQHSDLIVVSHS
jgi:hypothetical protein